MLDRKTPREKDNNVFDKLRKCHYKWIRVLLKQSIGKAKEGSRNKKGFNEKSLSVQESNIKIFGAVNQNSSMVNGYRLSGDIQDINKQSKVIKAKDLHEYTIYLSLYFNLGI